MTGKSIMTVLLVIALPAMIWADKYVNKNCVQNGDGSCWSCATQAGGAGAYNDFQASGSCLFNDPSWERGGTYWVAGSDSLYKHTCIRNTTGSGGMTIMKATEANHGTSVGWQAVYGTKPALWRGLNMQIDGIPVTVDGQTGQDTSGYGFKLTGQTDVFITHVSNCSPGRQIYRHLEITPSDYSTAYQYGLYFTVDSSLMQYCYVHHIGQLNLKGPGNHAVLEYCVFTDPGMHGNGEHAELMKDDGSSHDVTIRHNIFRNWQSTGGIILSGGEDNWHIYGNIFESTHGGFTCGNGVIAGLGGGAGTYTNIKIYNNTFANISTCATIGLYFTGPSNEVKNNVFYNVPIGICDECTRDYNWFFMTPNYTVRQPHDQNGTGDPFVDGPHGDYRLRADAATAIDRGTDLGAAYAIDRAGVARPQGAGWDMGAYEYTNTGLRSAERGLRNEPNSRLLAPNPIRAAFVGHYTQGWKEVMVYNYAGAKVALSALSQSGVYLVKFGQYDKLKKIVVVP